MMQCKRCGQDYEIRIASFFPEIPIVLCTNCYNTLAAFEKKDNLYVKPSDHFVCVDCGLIKSYID